jgi:hypothetical protein
MSNADKKELAVKRTVIAFNHEKLGSFDCDVALSQKTKY